MTPRRRAGQLALALLLGAVVTGPGPASFAASSISSSAAASATPLTGADQASSGLRLSNALQPGVLLGGTSSGSLAATVPAPCDPSASRYRLDVVSVLAADPAGQAATEAWAGRTLIGPATAGLPGPLDVTTAGSWQQLADEAGLALVPGTWTLALRCTDDVGARVLDEFLGDTVRFTTPTSWVVDEAVAAPTASTPGPGVVDPAPTGEPAVADRTFSATLAVLTSAPAAGAPVTLQGRVVGDGTAAPAGSCEFLDGATAVATAPVDPDGACQVTRSFAAGSHVLLMRFVPASGGAPATSPSVPIDVVLPADATVASAAGTPGELVIRTPYTSDNPLTLGDAVLALDGTSFSAAAPFDRVTIVDTRPGDPGWTASVDRADLTSGGGGVIAALHTGFEGVTVVYLPGEAGRSIEVSDVRANQGSADPQPFAVAAPGGGSGTVEIVGDLVLEQVPTSTPAGTYTTTVVLTVG